MIALIAASAIYLTALQATINAPRDAFKACLKEGDKKAKSEKVAADGYEAYLRNACGAKISTLRSALVAFDMKNGMSRKQAAEGADMMVDDWLLSAVDHYKFMAGVNTPQPKPAQPAAQAQAVQASAPATPK